MLLKELLNGIEVKGNVPDVEIKDIVTSSLDVKEGCLFVALKGTKADGHDFALQALKNGAAIVLCEKDMGVPYQLITSNTRISHSIAVANLLGRPADNLTLLGVTGTNGKTTTAYLTHQILTYCGKKAGLIGTVENITGLGAAPSKYTTPEPAQLQQLFAQMVDTGVEYVMMEVSSHALSQDRTAGLTYKVGSFTNLTQDHLDYHGTMENYLNEKLKLVDISERFVINIDDYYGRYFFERASGCAITYGINQKADLFAQNIVHLPHGSNFILKSPQGEFDSFIGIPGQFSIYNALCALGLAYEAGIDIKSGVEALRNAKGVCGRMENVLINRDYNIIIDYAHTPDGLENALQTLKEIPKKGRLIALFGCGGDRDKTKRPLMGAIACKYADLAIVTSDNPRTEVPEEIIKDILKGMENTNTAFEVIPDRKQAIRFAIENAREGDVILLAGKGHETYQILKDKTIHLDEREVIAEVLDE